MAVYSEVAKKQLNRTARFDAEYYQPHFLENIALLKANWGDELVTLGSKLVSISGGATPRGAEYPEKGIPFLRVQNIMPGYLELSDIVYISHETHNGELARSQLKTGDVLLTITGVSYGKAAYVPATLGPANINQHSVRMEFTEDLLPEYVATFLNCRFGRLQSDMKITGITRPALDYGEIDTFLIPLLNKGGQQEVQRVCRISEAKRQESYDLYEEAEELLLQSLGLELGDLSQEVAYERTFREIRHAERFDPQYYHPEKQRVLEQLANLNGEAVSAHFYNIEDVLVPPEKNTGESVRNYDLTDALRFFLDDMPAIQTLELGSNKKRFRKGDIVVSRLRSYLREIAIVETEGNCVGSTEFIVLRPRDPQKVTAELLLVYLRAEPVQRILKWCQDGSQHPRFKDDELLAIKLPERLLIAQKDIVRLVRTALDAHKESKRLLDEARRQVEEMISVNKRLLADEISE